MRSRRAAPPGKIRIIGGRWRGRRLAVAPIPALRPTPDRVRETLFNWLAPHIEGAMCLDCFAGSGVLGFEALSRGAAGAVLVEENGMLARMLRKQAEILDAGTAEIVHADIRTWLGSTHRVFDIVFVDPPFQSDLGARTCLQLLNGGHLAPGGVVYLESGAHADLPADCFRIVKERRAGRVRFRLLESVR